MTSTPFGGIRGETEIWAPAINSNQFWVTVGGNGKICEHKEFDPNWGSDRLNEEQTGSIMCCKSGN